MQKHNTPCIKTSAFAKLCNTNKRTLIHYDDIGLFKPAYTDEKGYRYYSESQCDVFFIITCLKDLGMPLDDIKAYIDHKNPERLTDLLLEQQKKVEKHLLHLKRIEQVIKNKLVLVNEGIGLLFTDDCSKPRLEMQEEAFFIASPRLDTSEHHILFSALCEHISYVNHEALSIGHPYGAVMRVSDLKRGITDQYAYFITRTNDFGQRPNDRGLTQQTDASQQPSILQKHSGLCAVIYLQGDYYLADEAFRRLFSFIAENDLTAGEFCYKEAVWDELTVESEKKYITRISVPVVSKKEGTIPLIGFEEKPD